MRKFVGRASLCAALAAALLFPASAQATTINLTLDNTATTDSYQQTTNNPCVFGKSCANGAFPLAAETLSGNDIDYTLNSGTTYTVQDIINAVGSTFFVGIDVNSTVKPNATEQLALFSMTVGGDTYIYSPGSPTPLLITNQGNGASDALLKGFDLTGYASSTQVVFNLDLRHATDGFEQFFLISSSAIPLPPVPEPASLTLLGLGLAGVARAVRRART